jgi:hypothetical protein
MAGKGKLKGRAVTEALPGQKQLINPKRRTAVSKPAANGKVTILKFQEFGPQYYFDEACFEKRSDTGSRTECVQ